MFYYKSHWASAQVGLSVTTEVNWLTDKDWSEEPAWYSIESWLVAGVASAWCTKIEREDIHEDREPTRIKRAGGKLKKHKKEG